jgi:hypothetical protein
MLLLEGLGEVQLIYSPINKGLRHPAIENIAT